MAGDDEQCPKVLAARRVKMKVITNAYDMDAKEDMWEKKYGNPHKRTIKGMKVNVGTKWFSLEEYRKAQEAGTGWMLARTQRMLELLNKVQIDKKHKNRKLMVKSYILQEAEAVSREAKMTWAKGNGIRIMSMQHDGIVVQTDRDVTEVAEGMEEAASDSCEYKVSVKAKML